MPMINWCYFSKKEVEKDENFLKSQDLSDGQMEAIKAYFYKRISANANWATVVTATIAIVVFWTDWF